MKLKTLAAVSALLVIMGLVGCSTNPSATTSPSSQAPSSDQSVLDASSSAAPDAGAGATITDADAKAIALEHAGLAEAEVTFVGVHLDYDDGRQIYEVDFYSGNTEYDYDIDAVGGQIVGYDTDIENYAIAQNNSPAIPEGVISESEAKTIALAKVSGATDANIRLYFDYDDGRAVYEGSIVHAEIKYEFEINAADGAVTEWDMESVYDD